ncbi:MAG TPA: DUF6220 domain-containing protein [Ktedonobacterales bacterium]|nr:DUF6220 domain-containing protein [Ktedonobacterales bacterium]
MQTLISTPPEAAQPITSAAVPVAPQTIAAIPGRAAKAHVVIARILLGGVMLQIFFAGLGVFGVSSFLPHMILGTLVILGSLALPLVAWRGRLGATLLRRSWLVVGLMFLQGLLIDAGRIIPLVAAFHPVNAMLLVLLVASMARVTRDR